MCSIQTCGKRTHGRDPCTLLLFGRPFVKRFALRYWTVVCLSRLSVTLVYCGQTVGWIRVPRGTEVGLGPCDIVLDRDPAPQKGAQQPPIVYCVYCCQTAAEWIKMPLGKTQFPRERGTAVPQFSAHVYCGQMVAHLGYS